MVPINFFFSVIHLCESAVSKNAGHRFYDRTIFRIDTIERYVKYIEAGRQSVKLDFNMIQLQTNDWIICHSHHRIVYPY